MYYNAQVYVYCKYCCNPIEKFMMNTVTVKTSTPYDDTNHLPV